MQTISNTLHTADCLETLSALPAGSVSLAYMDPPFNTGGKRSMGVKRGKARVGLTDPIDFDGAPEVKDAPSYTDRFGAPAAYIAYMRPRVEAVRAALTPAGSLFFHCDWRASHHVKLMLDEVFVAQGGVFVNEIIWRYGLGASRPGRKLLSKHDTIFWVARAPDYTFNLIRQAVSPAMNAKYSHTDEEGRRYMNSYGKRYYLKGGKPLDDVWDIPAIAATARERAGYPTQKPLALLERIVRLASQPGDLVLDPFCGSGTALVAAQRLGRRWIGIDANAQAIDIARTRLNTPSPPVRVR